MAIREWEIFAACAQVDPELFYPPRGGDNGAEAKRICLACPVLEACLADAMADEHRKGPKERHGIRGGLGPRQRARLARQQPTPQSQPAG
jgi:WhiB family transcriptional regulator, redox-sensing transcriptional regulator